MIGQEVSHYRILGKLGGGGMGVVYRAEDTRLGRVVALKFLNADLLANESTRKRFLHEARAASLIDHPNVCHVYEVGEADGRTFMAMNYCEGRSLREVIDSGPVPPREAFSIAFGVAQGLWAAHRRGIVHRDIKPANVIFTDDGFVRIVDFGLALLVGHSRVTTSGVTVGTVAYMSPEQTSGTPVGPNTDIWSLGVTLYEMLSGHLPFRGEIHAAMVYSIVHEPHTPLTSVPPECARIVDRCLEKDPAKRYQTIEELLEDMVSVARELGWDSSIASATIAPILRERRRRTWTRRVAMGAAVAVVVAGGAYGVYKWTHRAPPLFTTEVRLAVMPLDNLIGAENNAFVEGLSEHLARVARWVSRDHPSMWTVPYVSILNADLPEPTAAAESFGANRALTGNVQRFEDGYRLHLKFVDTKSGRELATAAVPFDLDAPGALLDSLAAVTAGFVAAPRTLIAKSPWRYHDAKTIRSYFEGLAFLQNPNEAPSPDLTAALLDSASASDSLFAALACAAGVAELSAFRRSRDTRHLQGALEHGRRAYALSPGFAEAAVLAGDAHERMALADSAESYYRAAVSADPVFVTATGRLGRLYEGQERVEEAETVFRNLATTYPDFWVGHRNLGRFYFDNDRLDEAAGAWSTALKYAPRDALTLNNLGAVHHLRGEWAMARELFLRSYQTRPNCESSSNVALTLYFDGKFEESAKYFEFALQYCDTTSHLPWGDLARALYWAPGGRPRAVTMYRKALGIARTELGEDPDNIGLMSFVIDYESMVENADGAREMIERIRPLLKDDESAMYRVGAVCEKLGQRETALDLIGDAIRHGFPVPEIRGDPMLQNLVADVRFQEMIRSEAAAEGAGAANNRP